MQRNQELVDFEVDPATGDAHVIDASEAGVDLLDSMGGVQRDNHSALTGIISGRAVDSLRPDVQDILAPFGALSPVHLALMGHGLSLSDQFWYRAPGPTERWEDINFFDNEWDPGFGEAVLSGDYARLATCSPDVPDATTSGRGVKAWERNEDGISLIKCSYRSDGAELMGAKLASDMCAALFDDGCYVPLDIVERYGKPCSANPLMLAPDEEFADGNRLFAMAGIQESPEIVEFSITTEVCNTRIGAYAAIGIEDASAHVARMACFSCLSLLMDFGPNNFGAIRKVGADAWRAAPIFDYGGAFGFAVGKGEFSEEFANLFVAKLLFASRFSFLDPSWDWSWYDPRALDGFEDRIVGAFGPYQNMPSNFGEVIGSVFAMQHAYVNGIASAQA
jgi:hypothetical protein